MTGAERRIRAFVVGIEEYEQSNLTNLNGPALDAVRFASWLLENGIPQRNIALFLKPLSVNEEPCRSIAGPLKIRMAKSESILAYLRVELRESVSEVLIIYWAGHGSMLVNDDRMVFLPDGGDQLRPCINITHLLRELGTSTFEKHNNSHFFIDACADFLKPDQNITPVELFPKGTPSLKSAHAQRFALYSASPGEQSANISGTNSGLASYMLMETLEGFNHWPDDPSNLFDTVVESMKAKKSSAPLIEQNAYVTREYPKGSTSELIRHSEFVGDTSTMRMMANVEHVPSTDQNDPKASFDLKNEDGVSRFRYKSRKALIEAGRITSSAVDGQKVSFSEGLYVKRDIEEELVSDVMTRRDVTPIRGLPGVGKTSLLWGVGAELTRRGWDVLFVQAPWLAQEGLGSDDSLTSHLLQAARGSRAQGHDVVTLIDTADSLIAQDGGLEALTLLVEALIAAEVAVVITCRPEEAKLMPTSWSRNLPRTLDQGLGDFSTTPVGERSNSEFELAVAAHAKAYQTRTGHPTHILVHHLVNAVSRKKPMARFCLRPLFLRMLFELYAPFAVPENLSITGLYEQYWAHRVQDDRRSPDHTAEVKAADLSPFVMELGKEMMRIGRPELRLNTIFPSGGFANLQKDLDAVRGRGVGDIKDGVFTFFHQTFFEFAAAKSLLDHAGSKAICVLISRAQQDVGNYFLLAVLEQTWLCAWNDPKLRHEANKVAEESLDESAKEVSGPLRQSVMNVLAQAPVLTPNLWGIFRDAVRNDAFDVFVPALRLLPTPSRSVGREEVELCGSGMSRADEGRSEALSLLSRLSDSAPQVLASLLTEDMPFIPPTGRDLEHKTITLVVSLVPHAPERVLPILSTFINYAKKTNRPGLLEPLLLELTNFPGPHSRDVASWCSREVKNPDPKLQRFLAQLHAQGIAYDLQRGGREEVLKKFWDVLERLMANDQVADSQADRDTFAGTLLAAVRPEISCMIPKLLFSMLLCGNPRMHFWLHHGLLVPILNSGSTDLQDFVASQIARGLPAPASNQTTLDSRWSDTLRRSLARLDLDLPTVRNLVGEVERLLRLRKINTSDLWLQADYLMEVMVRAAVAGIASAQDAMQQLESASVHLSPGEKSRLAQRLKVTEGTSAEKLRALKLLIAFRDINATKSLIKGVKTGELESNIAELQALVQYQLALPDPSQRGGGWDLAKTAVIKNLLAWPDISRYMDEIQRSKGNPPLALIELLELGLPERAYEAGDVLSATTQILDTRRSAFHEKKESAVRRTHVRALALAVPPADWRLVLDAAFKAPVEKNLIANAASIIVDQHRPNLVLAPDQKVQLLLQVGLRANDPSVSRIASKRGATAWRRGIVETLRVLTPSQRLELLENLHRMDPDFAVEIGSQINPIDSEDLKNFAQQLCADDSTHPRLRKILQSSLKQSWMASTPHVWLQLDEDLDAALRRNREDLHLNRQQYSPRDTSMGPQSGAS